MPLQLRNPHSVLLTLAQRPHDVLEVRISGSKPSPGWADVIARAHELNIPVRTELAERESTRGNRGGRTSVSSAIVQEKPPLLLEELFAGHSDGIWLALDCLQDPQNVGAIFRSAAFFGVRGIVVSRDQSAPITATVYDVASGGVEMVPFSQPPNLSRALETAKKAGVWVLGTSEHATKSLGDIQPDRPWLIVLGSEERGLRRLTSESCDELCQIPSRGVIQSLNVSVATGIILAALSPST